MQLPVCIQLSEVHDQLLSAHIQQVYVLSDTSTTFLRVRPSIPVEGPLLATPGCESSAVRSLLLGSTRNCHCSTRQPNYINQSHKIICMARSGKVITHNLPTKEALKENVESAYKFERHAIQQNILKLFI